MQNFIAQLEKNKTVFYDLLKNEKSDMISWKQSSEKWDLLHIVCHLYDEERNDFRFRVQWTLERPDEVPPAINPIEWVKENDYVHQDYDVKLNDFIAEREQSITWLNNLKDVNWDNGFEHPKLGRLSARHFLTNWLAHDYLHMRQILRLKFDYLQQQSGESLDYAGNW